VARGDAANVERNHVLHEHVVIVSIETQTVSYVAAAEYFGLPRDRTVIMGSHVDV
jgi:hypothetical protein